MFQESLNRRQWIGSSSLSLAAVLAAGRGLHAADEKPKKLLYYSKSTGFQHSVVKRQNGQPSYSERMMNEFAKKYGFEVTSTKDGRIFDKDYEQFDGFLFYTTENLTEVGNTDKEPAMTAQGKQNLLEAIKAGKGFAGAHSASDTFHFYPPNARKVAQTERDPYIEMIGGEFIKHGAQQSSKMRVVDKAFPGVSAAGEGFDMHEEWYSLKNFATDMHVILVQETSGMKGPEYDRPAYPATWARMHGKGRVFYTSMGHREDVWTRPEFESIFIGGINWTLGRVEASIPTNFNEVTPDAIKNPPLP